jgi:hypothetical protein
MWLLGYICKCNEYNLLPNEMNKGQLEKTMAFTSNIYEKNTYNESWEKKLIFHVKPKNICKALGKFLKCIWKACYIHDSLCHLCMFKFMIAFASSLTMSKAHGCATFSKLEVRLNYCLVLGPLSWECPILKLYPTDKLET